VRPRERLIIPLDFPTADEARRMAERLAGEVGMLKVGLQLFTAAGPGFVRELADQGHGIFLDLKYHDIPNTVAGAVAAASALGVAFVDVHALAGREALAAAAAARRPPTRTLAVTILTSHAPPWLDEAGVAGPIETAVLRLARLARDAGIDGVVASPGEVAAIREACGTGFLIVTPGIRPAGSATDDQARTATPKGAIEAGADYLVVGRPITRAADPVAAARRVVDEIAN